RPVIVLSTRNDAHARASADGRVFRIRCACGQCGDRWPDRFAWHSGPTARPTATRDRHESHENCRGILLFAHTGQVLLDARTPIDALRYEAELLALQPGKSALTGPVRVNGLSGKELR